MAFTSVSNSDVKNVNHWSKVAFTEALKPTLTAKLMGSNVIQWLKDLEKDAGDTIKYDLLMQMTGAGITGDNRLKDNEEALTYHQDSVIINQLRNGHAFKRMSQQRTLHDLRADAQRNLSDWFAGKFDEYLLNCLCGNTSHNFGQAATAPDTDHYIVTGDVAHTGVVATDEGSLGSNDQFGLHDLDYAKEKAKTITPMIRPAKIDGEEFYVAVLHPYAVTDLRLNVVGSTYMTWKDINYYAASRGLKNNIFTGALGVYNGVVLFEDTRVYSPVTSVRRNVLLGEQAAVFALGSAYDKPDTKVFGKLPMSWEEERTDFGNEKGIACGCIFGVKATKFNSKDYGKIIMSSYSVVHN